MGVEVAIDSAVVIYENASLFTPALCEMACRSCHILKRKHGMNFLDASIAAEGEQTRQWQSSNFTNEHEKPVTNTTSMLNNTTFLIFSL